ncbi:MAG: globin domain-containing protein [Phreatobacter sp.]|jgi:hemoglobin-like flavoprotein|uniref:globin domain-containing protein n=1 Tax=Phreatobacter sp. TaxID=1966341 RepID=UPI004035BE2A
MTPDQIALIRQQFGLVARRADAFAADFYDNLFHLDGTLRPMFPADLSAQRGKLVKVLAHVILSLDDLGAVIDDVRALGAKHVGYGVSAGDYQTVGIALLKTLGDHLGDRFDDASRAAWARCYGTLADVMTEDGAARAAA